MVKYAFIRALYGINTVADFAGTYGVFRIYGR